jgi:AcrR family transcriptional regulator
MPAALDEKQKQVIVNRLFEIFRDHGYEGTSLAELSKATGLGKSSLYHHFPGGKEQMAEAVLGQGEAFVRSAIFDVAMSAEPLKGRIRKIISAFNLIYDDGRNYCLLGRLSCDGIGKDARTTLRGVVKLWIDAIARLARDSGMPPAQALQFGKEWFTRVQGAIILHAANGDTGPYERAMESLVDLGKTGKAS